MVHRVPSRLRAVSSIRTELSVARANAIAQREAV
jgi:hypothetical protein